MKQYKDYTDIKNIPWTKYKIVTPTHEDKNELMEAFKHMHDSDVDAENIAVNQIIHEYRDIKEGELNNIIVDPELYYTLNTK